jgi:hypothetical protein
MLGLNDAVAVNMSVILVLDALAIGALITVVQERRSNRVDSFVRHTAVRFTSRRPVSKIGNQGMSARDEIFVSRGFDECVRNAHGLFSRASERPAEFPVLRRDYLLAC